VFCIDKVVDRVHGAVDRRCSRSTVDWRRARSTVARSGGGGQCSPEHELTGVLVRGTLPWRRGEQEKGTGIPTPVGMRQQRGSSGRALAKVGGGGASSMRRCSGRGGEGRRRAVSVVWRGRGGGAFYRHGEEGKQLGEGGRRLTAIEVS
jgi:hypothetical protein